MKSRQFCSVCKEWLEMEVVPTSDGEEDDGVIWFRCPQCQGFLPKLSGAELKEDSREGSPGSETAAPEETPEPAAPAAPAPEAGGPAKPKPKPKTEDQSEEELPWDSPADMMEARRAAGDPESLPELEDLSEQEGPVPETDETDEAETPAEPEEPIHEYAAMLEARGEEEPAPYRPWETYEVGQCIHHQAWEDCGVVVAKEDLPGGRQVIKCYFEEAGVVRLIEKAPK